MQQRKEIVRKAINAALALRAKHKIGMFDAVEIYDLADRCGIDVWFADFPSLEGMYSKGPKPAIILSTHRPTGRRAFTCAHELGHHIFGHGSRIDDTDSIERLTTEPEEFLADCFAGALLMPKSAVQRAFSIRGWSINAVSPEELFAISNWFGVGYAALIQHLRSMLQLISPQVEAKLKKFQPKEIRQRILGNEKGTDLVVVDQYWLNRAIDLNVGDLVCLPPETLADDSGRLQQSNVINGRVIFQATAPGLSRVFTQNSQWSAFVRISRQNYVGRSIYRHLAEVD